MWCTFNEQNMSKKECDTAWDYEMHLLYNIFQTESNVMVDSGKIIGYIYQTFPSHSNATDALYFSQ